MPPKRSAPQESSSGTSSKTRATGDGERPSLGRGSAPMEDEDELQFEDPWEDENDDSEEEIVDAGDNEDEDEDMEVDGGVTPALEDDDEAEPAPSVFIPGTHTLAQDEVLEPDMTSYEMLHAMSVNWPCLSFDVLRDSLGDDRQKYPHTAYVVAGTQADAPNKNEVLVMKMSQLHRTQKDLNDEESDDDEDDDEDALDEDAVVEFKSIPHQGGVNRIRAQPLPASLPVPPVTSPYYAASWADTGKVHIWDVRPLIAALDSPGHAFESAKTSVYTVNSHGHAEGFAMDWGGDIGATNASSSLRLLTGDIASKIYLTTSTPSGFTTNAQPFTSHTSSVEDLQWSPSELTVFASCSADASVRVWDVRVKKRQSVVGIPDAHSSDVNVISWNRSSSHLLLSGGDDGALKVWDLRSLKAASASAPSPVASFTWHSAPITSVEWHGTDESTFAASAADDQVTLWDLAVEQDADEMKEEIDPSGREVPPQLLFIHQGQTEVKEVHWHPQIPGALVSTSMDGFNVFKTISV